MRILEVPIKPGMIRQALVTLNTRVRGRLLQEGEILNVQCPEIGLNFSTDIVCSTLRFRERAAFTRIFEKYAATENDVLVFEEKTKGHWILTVRKRPAELVQKINNIKKHNANDSHSNQAIAIALAKSKKRYKNRAVDVPRSSKKQRTSHRSSRKVSR